MPKKWGHYTKRWSAPLYQSDCAVVPNGLPKYSTHCKICILGYCGPIDIADFFLKKWESAINVFDCTYAPETHGLIFEKRTRE